MDLSEHKIRRLNDKDVDVILQTCVYVYMIGEEGTLNSRLEYTKKCYVKLSELFSEIIENRLQKQRAAIKTFLYCKIYLSISSDSLLLTKIDGR